MPDREERRAAAIERATEAVALWRSMVWNEATDREIARAALDASGLLDDEYEQVGEAELANLRDNRPQPDVEYDVLLPRQVPTTTKKLTGIVRKVREEATMPDREERRAAGIADVIAEELVRVDGRWGTRRTAEHIAERLDASGLLDDDDPPPAPIQADPAWLDSEFSGRRRKVSRDLPEREDA